MISWGRKIEDRPAPSPYCQGYLDAAASGTYISRGAWVNWPKDPRFIGPDAEHAWREGVADYIQDRMLRPRTHRGLPPHAII